MPTFARHSGNVSLSTWMAALMGGRGGGAKRADRIPADALDVVPDPVLFVDADDCVCAANQAVGTVLGYDPDDLIGEGLAEMLFLPAHRDAHRARLQVYAATGRDAADPSEPVRVVRANGTEVEAEMTLRATGAKRTLRFAVCLRDVNTARAAEAGLAAAESRQRTLKTIVDAVPDPIVAVNRAGRVVLRNRAGALDRVAGPDAHESEDGLPADDLRKAEAVMRSGVPTYDEEPGPGGSVRFATRVPVQDPTGAVVGLVAISRDVTAQKSAEAALRAEKRTAEDAARANREFLATTSHEVRTLMSGVTGMTTLLLGTDLDEEQRDFVDTVRSSSDALLTVINDVLDLSKMEAGRLTVENRPFRVRRVLKDALSMVSQQAAAKGLDVSSDVDAAIPDVVHGDDARIRQVLANLLTNAVKFTSEGSVTVHASTGPQTAAGGPALAITVTDTGIGIAPERLDAVFERFEQADASTARTHGGTGLGLAICRQLVHAMGGELSAESAPGGGSAFRFTIALGRADGPPAPRPAAEAPASADASADASVMIARPVEAASASATMPEPSPDPEARPERAVVMSMDAVLPSASVLVVEDDAVLQRVTALTLRRLGYKPDVVGNGLEAVEAVRAQAYDVVLMDVMMPVMDGLEATRQIRADPGPHPAPAIVALTANAMEEDRRNCLQAGCDDYLAKPVQPRHLASTIEVAIRSRSADPVAV